MRRGMRGRPMPRRMGRPGLLGTVARTAVVAGTATAVVGGVHRHQDQKSADQQAADAQQQQLADQQQQLDAQQQQLAQQSRHSRRCRSSQPLRAARTGWPRSRNSVR